MAGSHSTSPASKQAGLDHPPPRPGVAGLCDGCPFGHLLVHDLEIRLRFGVGRGQLACHLPMVYQLLVLRL